MRKGFVKTLLFVGLCCRLRKIHLHQWPLMVSKHLSGGRHLHTGKQWLGFHLPVYVHFGESHQERVIEMPTFESNSPKKSFYTRLMWFSMWKNRKLGDSSTFAEQVVTWRTLNSHDSWLHCLRSLSSFPMTHANMAGDDNDNYLWTNDEILWSLPWKKCQTMSVTTLFSGL